MSSERRRFWAVTRMALVTGIACVECGCAGVEAWERGVLAEYIMRSDRDPAGDAMADHVYASREAAYGGRGTGGGGCGCN